MPDFNHEKFLKGAKSDCKMILDALSKNDEKSSPSTKVNIDEFSNFISHCKNKWSARQKIIAFRSLKTLKFGNKTIFKKNKFLHFTPQTQIQLLDTANV